MIDKVSRAIVGQSIDDRLPLLHEIISGPFDADKLDYFVRDAHNAGTPSLLDISRLVQKIALREMAATELPGNTGRDIQAKDQHVLVGIKWSGISVLDELHLSRVLLYAKIYRHPKVVAIEQMVRSALVMLAAATDVRAVFRLVYQHNDDELLAMSAPVLASALGINLSDADQFVKDRINKASSILLGLRTRRLTVKVFQLQRTYPGGNQSQDEHQKQGLIDFREVIEHPQDREKFRLQLIDEVEKILRILGDEWSRVDLEGAIMLHPIGKTPGGTQIGRAYLITKTGSPMEFKDYLVNRTAWADGYLSDQPAGYAFADPDIADAVFVATERLLRINYGIILPDSALEMSKRDPKSIAALKAKLKTSGYYDDAPFDLRPEPPRLSHADVARAISEFKPKYDAYQAPVEQHQTSTPKEDAKTATKRWLRQFDSDDNVECAVRVLEFLRVINRADTVEAVRRFISTNPAFQGGVVVPFGSARDSGAVHGYFAADLKGKLISECLTLDDAFQQGDGRPIIFLDDFVGSGGQTRDILAAGFGRPDLRVGLGEDRNLFSNNIQDFLKSSHIGFVFTAAWDDGIEEVNEVTKDLKLDATVYRYITEKEIPFLSEALKGIPVRQTEAFTSRCAEIGVDLLRSESKRKNDESEDQYQARLAGRALGYGNRGMLLASPFNVPTQTLTPLWAWGKTNGVDWTPLLPRRKKL